MRLGCDSPPDFERGDYCLAKQQIEQPADVGLEPEAGRGNPSLALKWHAQWGARWYILTCGCIARGHEGGCNWHTRS